MRRKALGMNTVYKLYNTCKTLTIYIIILYFDYHRTPETHVKNITMPKLIKWLVHSCNEGGWLLNFPFSVPGWPVDTFKKRRMRERKNGNERWNERFGSSPFVSSLFSLLIHSTTKGDNEHVSVPHIPARYGADLLVGNIIIEPILSLKLCQ